MGQKDSKPSNGYGYSSDYGGTSSGYNSRNTGSTSSSYGARYVPSSENNVQPETHARLQRKYSRIGDESGSLDGMATSFAGTLVCIATFGLCFPLAW
jgi:E3 ubiquitin-protein ligase RGLG